MKQLLPFPLISLCLLAMWLWLSQSLSPGAILLGSLFAVQLRIVQFHRRQYVFQPVEVLDAGQARLRGQAQAAYVHLDTLRCPLRRVVRQGREVPDARGCRIGGRRVAARTFAACDDQLHHTVRVLREHLIQFGAKQRLIRAGYTQLGTVMLKFQVMQGPV